MHAPKQLHIDCTYILASIFLKHSHLVNKTFYSKSCMLTVLCVKCTQISIFTQTVNFITQVIKIKVTWACQPVQHSNIG